MQLKIKLVHPRAQIPTYAYEGDACLDLYAADIHREGEVITYDIGIALEIPLGYVGLIFPRSSIYKTGEMLTNSVGVVDSGYRGTLSMKTVEGVHLEGASVVYQRGDRVAQLMLLPVPYVELIIAGELSETRRGALGYGSSGSK